MNCLTECTGTCSHKKFELKRTKYLRLHDVCDGVQFRWQWRSERTTIVDVYQMTWRSWWPESNAGLHLILAFVAAVSTLTLYGPCRATSVCLRYYMLYYMRHRTIMIQYDSQRSVRQLPVHQQYKSLMPWLQLLRFDYDPTTTYRERLWPIRRKQKSQFFVAVVS